MPHDMGSYRIACQGLGHITDYPEEDLNEFYSKLEIYDNIDNITDISRAQKKTMLHGRIIQLGRRSAGRIPHEGK